MTTLCLTNSIALFSSFVNVEQYQFYHFSVEVFLLTNVLLHVLPRRLIFKEPPASTIFLHKNSYRKEQKK